MTDRRQQQVGGRFKPDTTRGYRHELIGEPECPYLERWVYVFPGGYSLRVHHFFQSDEDHLHDHPFWFLTLILRGSYMDVQENGVREWMTPGAIAFRPALHRHRVVTTGCWTLVLTGPKIRDWGFWVDGLWMRQRAYFKKYVDGRAACQ